METNGAPLWAQELRKFTEVSLKNLDKRLNMRISDHGASIERLTRKIEHMDVRITTRLDALSTDVAQLRGDVDGLKTDVGVLKTDVGALKTDVGALKTDVGALKTDVAQVKDDVGEIKGRLTAIERS
jgi:outer membrane murein-binding lipoprotein Lpp